MAYGTRTVQLARRRDGSLGFSLRGGREHGTGVYISQVEPNSSAQLHGLKVSEWCSLLNVQAPDQEFTVRQHWAPARQSGT